MGVNLKDIAQRAGVSLATVSNVVNGYRPVGERTRQRVQQAIDELGYSPNLGARHLRRGRTGLIALAVPELNNPYFAELAEIAIAEAAGLGYTLRHGEHRRGPGGGTGAPRRLPAAHHRRPDPQSGADRPGGGAGPDRRQLRSC